MNLSDKLDKIQEVENSDLQVCYIDDGAKNLVVSFASVNHGGFERKKSLVRMSEEIDIDILYLRGGWYIDKINGIGETVDDSISYLKDIFAKYEKVICVGSSAGGYGAILYGSLLNVDVVVAYIPQTDLQICRRKLPRNSDYRVLSHLSCYGKYSNLKNVINESTEYYVRSKEAEITKGLRGKTKLNIVEHGMHHFRNISEFPNVHWSDFDWFSYDDMSGIIQSAIQKMKIAVCYRGHYFRKGGAWIPEQLGSDFSLCYENHKEKLFPYLDNYDVFFHTYSHTQTSDEKLVETLQPKKYIIDKEVHPKISYSMIQSSSLVGGEYDFIINLRFDLLFLKPFNDFNVEYDKFNFMFREKEGLGGRRKIKRKKNKIKNAIVSKLKLSEFEFEQDDIKISDLIFFYDRQFNDNFISSLETTIDVDRVGPGHYILPELNYSLGREYINPILSEFHSSSENTKNGYIVINREIAE